MAQAFWITGKEQAALREITEGEGDVRIEALFSGISRGTENLVFHGRVPSEQAESMRCPFQEGNFPFPVKYGYASVGMVREGPSELIGRPVFCLYPHQDFFRVPVDAVRVLPDGLDPAIAVLGANMETALNIVWDSEAAPGDRICVLGAGVVGALTAWLAARIAGTQVTLIDVNAERGALADRLGVAFAAPETVEGDCDIVINASASAAGLQTAIELAGMEGRIVEASWFGTRSVEIGLGGAFHSRRLSIVSSQVGAVPARRRARWDYSRRLDTALRLLTLDPAIEALISGETPFLDMADAYGSVLADPATLCHRISYSN